MAAVTTFDSTKESLLDMLRHIHEGKSQLPDFQRGWVWDNDHIVSLLASISQSYPIGAVMMLQAGNTDVRFKPRPVEGVTLDSQIMPERYILDGQQRLTSLYQAILLQKVVETRDTRGKRIRRWYYLDINKSLSQDGDREDAIISIAEDRHLRNFRGEVVEDYSTPEREYAAHLFPISQIFDCSDWRQGFNSYWNYNGEKVKLFDAFEKEVVKRFEQYQVPMILLRKETPKEAVCQVFEKVNTGGVSLNVFELLTATYAADDFSLRDDWAMRRGFFSRSKLLDGLESSYYLQAISLLSTYQKRQTSLNNEMPAETAPAVSCKRKEILRLSLDEYQRWAEKTSIAFENAAKFLHSQKIFSARDIPYQTQLTPLAAMLAMLGTRAENDGVKTKLARWFWSGVLGELYGGAIETRFARDLPEVLAWIDGGPEPITIIDAVFSPVRLYTLRTRNSAAYKGIHALLLRDGCLDFRTGDPIDMQMYYDNNIDIHHIFSQDWCSSHKIDKKRADCIVNKTPVDARTNRTIGGNAPSRYLPHIQRVGEFDTPRMDQILKSHMVDPELLRTDDFGAFFAARETILLDLIGKAMGKPISRVSAEEESDEDYQMEDEVATIGV